MTDSENAIVQTLFDFQASFGDELSFKAGDVLKILYRIDQDWVHAKLLVKQTDSDLELPTGNVPSNYYRLLKMPDSLLDQQRRLYLAKHNFPYSEVGDLDFIKGQLVVSLNSVDQNWCFGCYMNDSTRTGIFPLSHVSRVYLSGSVDDDWADNRLTDSNRNSDSSELASLNNSVSLNSQTNARAGSAGRQAKVIQDFDPEALKYGSNGYRYLSIQFGDYVLVRSKVDDNWIEVENFKGEKGLIPASNIEYTQEQHAVNKDAEQPLPILNRTQRRYTILSSDSIPDAEATLSQPNQYSIETSQYEEPSSMTAKSLIDHEEHTSARRTFCQALYDFHPLGDRELGCLKDEYLEIVEMKATSEWMSVRNIHGKQGQVPANYMNVLDTQHQNSLAQKQFEDHDKKKVDRSIDPLVKEAKRSAQSVTITPMAKVKLNELGTASSKTRPIDLEADSSSKPSELLAPPNNNPSAKEPYKPPIPPKPRMVKPSQSLLVDESNLERNTSNSNSSLSEKSFSETTSVKAMASNFDRDAQLSQRPSLAEAGVPRRVVRPNKPFYNPDLLAKIKNLESFIEKQKTAKQTVSTTLIALPEEPQNSTSLEGLERNLSEMKSLFVETARNPELAKRQIGSSERLNDVSPKSDSDAQQGSVGKLSSASSDDSLGKHQSRREKKIKQRRFAIQELIETERKFYQELTSAYDLFATDENAPVRFRREIMNELKPIIEVSRSLLDTLRTEIDKKRPLVYIENDLSEPDSFEIGACLSERSEDMKKAYAKYIRDHASLDVTIKNYESDQVLREYIRNKLGKSETDINSKLSNVFIKPVQRIFKYPLLIGKLIENTQKSQPDYEGLIEASLVFKNMLDYINEYKRRQDITSKYLDKTKSLKYGTLTDKLKTIAKPNTVRKKVSRLSMDVSFFLGISNQQVYDENFERLELLFRKVEKVLKFIIEYVEQNSYELKELLDCEAQLFYSLKSLLDVDAQAFTVLYDAALFRSRVLYKKYDDAVHAKVLKPLNQLLRMYSGPNMLISKRRDKKLDYESVLSESRTLDAVNNEKRLETAKRDYDALNDQLVEDLPQLIESSVKVLEKVAGIFMVVSNGFVSEVNENLKKSVKESNIYNLDLTDHHSKAIAESMNNLKHHLTQQLAVFAPEKIKKQQTQMQKQFLKTKYQAEELYVVTQNYEGDESECQLSVSANDVLVLLKPFDPIGRDHIWFVFNGETRGFLPSKILKPLNEPAPETKSSSREAYERMRHMSLINFDQIEPSRTPEAVTRSISAIQASPGPDQDSNKHEKCRALYNCQPLATNGIQLKKDQLYKVIDKTDKRGNSDWWLLESFAISSETKRREVGYAPKNYVELILSSSSNTAPEYQNDMNF